MAGVKTGISGQINNNIVTDGLVFYVDPAYKKSYPRTGTNVFNLASGSLTPTGNLESGTGFVGLPTSSFTFDGTDDYIDFGTTLSDFTTELTIDFFGKISGSPTDGILITKGENDSSSTSNFGFQIQSSNKLRLYAKASGQGYTVVDSNSNITDNNINNYTLVYNSGNVYFYKNGTLFSSHTFGLNSLPSTSGPLSIGRLKGYGNYFPGNVYSVKVYNRALSASDVLQNYQAQKERFGF
tara:strand:- start:30 stop:746 length:717 start_codon:yes stop_codon:yes gene_type:complete